MTGYAASGDTWGMASSDFLFWFAVAAVVLHIVLARHRKRLFAGTPAMRPLAELHPVEVAYLSGGPKLAVYSALASLRHAKAIGTGRDHTLTQTGTMPLGVAPLEQALYNAAGQGVASRTVADHPWVRGALDRLRERLEDAGLLPTRQARLSARLGGLALLALAGVGVARVADGIANDRPVGFLIALLVVLFLSTLPVLVGSVPQTTGAGRRRLVGLRAHYGHLSPEHRPSFAVYGAAGAAMGVALYGTTMLWAMDPAFAEDAEIGREQLQAGGGAAVDVGGVGSEGSSDGGGGGGCGGGCGGCGCGG